MTLSRLLVISLSLLTPFTVFEAAANEREEDFEKKVRPKLTRLCADCHSPDDDEHPITFLRATTARAMSEQRGIWKSVAEQLRNRTMPPSDAEQPSEQDRLELATWIETTLRESAREQGPFAGFVTTRRLNREEYARTIENLLGVRTDAATSFPVDGSGGEGFNNNGETLFLPPILMERYLDTAGKALDEAIVSPTYRERFAPGDFLGKEPPKDDRSLTIAPKSEAAVLVTVFITGNYSVVIDARALESPSTMQVKVDGIRVGQLAIDAKAKSDGEKKESIVVRLSRGTHAIALRTIGQTPIEVASLAVAERRKSPSSQRVANHVKLIGSKPGEVPKDRDRAAREIVSRFARRAFRRPVSEAELKPFLALYERSASRDDPFEESIKLALKGVLVSPAFLFRIEAEPTSTEREPLDDHELAVRLSYFLWSTMPDEELFRLAGEGKLHQDEVLIAQVDRMLDDPKADYFAESFMGQWLGTNDVGARVAPSTSTFKGEFTTELLLDMREEPARFFGHLIASDGSLLDLLDSDYAVINARLAKHYGYVKEEKKDGEKKPWPWSQNPKKGSGGPFKRFPLPDDRRGGLLGMGGVHLRTSYPSRTSPVLRGGWVLETLLGVHLPSPPPDVPELKINKKKQTVREQLALHRDNPSCAACHNLMDPIGFSLENFDVLGRWREEQNKAPIDASASLPTGETFEGPGGLKKALLGKKDQFLRHLTGKMLGYALGRSLVDRDDHTILAIADKLEDSGYRTRVLVREIALSPPFRERQRESEDVRSKPGKTVSSQP
ncbi:hypothetical protein Pan216_19140 [Planctomycetes bacterium Pan216]|uniref:Planctomycete cytochrome C n=1 Tax=Kolteria novifilia TaxID=2527975 RepID=A0A518B246_9BACT|nr:hypothetical protein Pan216_19140 [Planctomycetes bacterium Pan216]